MEFLSQLLAPITAADFFGDFWRKKPLLVVEDKDFSDVLTLDDVNDYFGRTSFAYPFLRVVGNGSEIDLARYSMGAPFNILNKDAVFRLFNEGNSIVIQASQHQMPKLYRAISILERELAMEVNANIYITPSNSQGFHPHFDTHEVLVLQITGTKHWNIYDIPIEAPLQEHKLTEAQKAAYRDGEPAHRITLQEGDLLYVPRGVVHDAFCTGELSIHITFGLTTMVKMEILHRLVGKLAESAWFREPYLPQNDFTKRGAVDREMIHRVSSQLEDLLHSITPYSAYNEKFKPTENLFSILAFIDNAHTAEDLSVLRFTAKEPAGAELEKADLDILSAVLSGEFLKGGSADLSIDACKKSLKQLVRRGLLEISTIDNSVMEEK